MKSKCELLDDLLSIGNQMSNVCFNLSQKADQPIEKVHAAIMRNMQEQWDKLYHEYNEAKKRCSCGG